MSQVHCFNLNPRVQGEYLMSVVLSRILELAGASYHPIFMGNLSTIGHMFSLVYPVDECPFKEMKTWGQSEISFYCLVFGVN